MQTIRNQVVKLEMKIMKMINNQEIEKMNWPEMERELEMARCKACKGTGYVEYIVYEDTQETDECFCVKCNGQGFIEQD